MTEPSAPEVEYVEWDPALRPGNPRVPLGAALLRAAAIAGCEFLVVVGSETRDHPDPALMTDAFERSALVAAVVPRVLWPDGSVAEAGAVLTEGGQLSGRTGGATNRSELSFTRPVDGTRFGYIALRRSLVGDLAIDAGLDDAVVLAEQVTAQFRARALTVLFEPRWTVTAPSSGEPAGSQVPARGWPGPARERILVVAATVSDQVSWWSDSGIHDLLDAVTSGCPYADAVVACAEGVRNDEAMARLRAGGIEVAGGGTDWSRWFADRAYQFSHVIVTDGGLLSGLARHALDSQPQAAKVLWTATSAFRTVEAMLPMTPHAERAGHEHVLTAVAARALEVARQFDSVWCERPDDYEYFASMLSVPSVKLLSRPVAFHGGAVAGYRDRWGLAVIALPGSDVVAGHEDAAVCAAEEIFPPLYRRDPGLRLRVVADRPSPMVARLARHPGVVVEDPGPDGVVGLLAQARVVLAPYRHGVGGPSVVRAAMAARTPCLTTAIASRGVILGDLGSGKGVTDPFELVDRAWTLHAGADVWNRRRGAMDLLARENYSRAGFGTGVADALVELGVRPLASPSRRVLPPIRVEPGCPTPILGPPMGARLALRASTPAGVMATETAADLSEAERYRMWCRRRGPTASVLASLAAAISDLPYRPTISIITPVYNTDPELLEATLASVRDQIYPHWELCLADDGSTDEGARRVLTAWAEDPRLRVIRLPQQSGIVAASNAALSLASGEYVAFLDHDDLLKPHALAQVVRWLNDDPDLDLLYSDEDKIDETGQLIDPYFKPDWSPDLLMSRNYINHLTVLRRSLVEKLGGFRSGFDGSQDYDLLLRLTEQTEHIAHIAEPLYTWRMGAGSTAAQTDAKPYAFDAAKRALQEAMERRGEPGRVGDGMLASIYRTQYSIPGCPRVAIVIPTRDRVDLLRRCVDSVRARTAYRNYDITVIDNASQDPETLKYLATFGGRVLRYPAAFNYARMLNLAVASLECDALLFLNNDTEVINGDWIDALLEHAMRPKVGAVGGRLYYPDGRLQHEGILVGILGVAANLDHGGFWALGDLVRNCSAVTGACVMIRPAVYWAVGGNDERLRIAYNDVDICLRIRQAGYQVVYTPYATLFHFEGASRAGREHDDDKSWFTRRWHQDEEWDPYYSPNFDRDRLFKLAL